MTALLLGAATPVTAQGFRLSGHVYTVDAADTVPLPDHWVVMHQVSLSGGAAVDSSRTDRFGGYFLLAPDRDTTALYLASVAYKDINYFTRPVEAVEFTTDTAETLFVFDTSSTQPQIHVAQRHVVVRAPERDGSRSILEFVVLANRGTVTRIVADTSRPVWEGALPDGAVNLEVGDGDVSPEAVYRRGDRVAVSAPVPPGEKQVVFAYTVPGERTFRVPIRQPVDRLMILTEDTAATAAGVLRRVGAETLQNLVFTRFESNDVGAGSNVEIRFSGTPFNIVQLWWMVVVAAALTLAATTVVWWRRAPAVTVVDNPDVLAARIAALDESFEARAATASGEERTAYERTRADLKRRLTAALAKARGSR